MLPYYPPPSQPLLEQNTLLRLRAIHTTILESFTCAKIVGPGMDDADRSVDTVAFDLGATPSDSLKRGSNLPPLTPGTGCKLRKFCVEESDEDDDEVLVDRKDVTDVLDDGRDDEEGSC
ncbi:hypothetical protein HanPI659440_Chr08g0303411 [Helianthus annuus]|nr:hypothetical protein HanPI659440_Chr08g0303411 [Helianthus annuus]